MTRQICGIVEGPVSAEVVALDHDGMALIAAIRLIYDNYAFPTEILASVRHGADVMTAPPAGTAISGQRRSGARSSDAAG